MGRPEDCNCCEDFGNPPLPPITDCDGAICIAFIDENNDSNGRDTVDAKFAEWVKAFPNRILFVVDVFVNNPLNPNGTPKLYFPDGWDDHNNAFNLRGEFIRGLSVPEFCNRDNGDVGLATDVWAALNTIATDRGISTELASAADVSIFVDTTNSMPDGTVQAAYNLLVSEAESAGKTIATSTFNSDEDYICPFVNSNCCPNEFVKPLQDLCNVTPTCEPSFLRLTNNSVFGVGPATGRTSFLIREYIDYDPDNPPSEEWYSIYGGVERAFGIEYGGKLDVNTNDPNALAAETNAQQLVMLAEVTNSEGTSLDFVDINYVIEYSDDDGSTWTQIQDLGNVLSGQTLTKKFLVDEYNGSSSSDTTQHDLLGSTISDYTDSVWQGRWSNAKRTYDRQFRIIASAPDYPALGSIAFGFSLEEYRVAGRITVSDPDPVIETEFLIDDQSLDRIFFNTSLFRWFNDSNLKREFSIIPNVSDLLINGRRYSEIPDYVFYSIEYKVEGEYRQEAFSLTYEQRDQIDLSYDFGCPSTETFYTNWSSPNFALQTGSTNPFFNSSRNRLDFARRWAGGLSNSMYPVFSNLLKDDGWPIYRRSFGLLTPEKDVRNRYDRDTNDPKQSRQRYYIYNERAFDEITRNRMIDTGCVGADDFVPSVPLFTLEGFARLYLKDKIVNTCNCSIPYYDPNDGVTPYRLNYFGIELLRSNREYRLVATINNTNIKIKSPVFRPLFLCYDQRVGNYGDQYVPCRDIDITCL